MEKIGINPDNFVKMIDVYSQYVDKPLNDLIIKTIQHSFIKNKKPVDEYLIDKIKLNTSYSDAKPISLENQDTHKKINVSLLITDEDRCQILTNDFEKYPKELSFELKRICGFFVFILKRFYIIKYSTDEGKLYRDIIGNELFFDSKSSTLYIDEDCPFKINFLITEN